MLTYLQSFLYFAAILSAALWFYNSIKSKRTNDAKKRGLFIARMNIAMGTMLICIACVQLFLFYFDSWIRVSVGFIFLLLGCFNVFAGIRNHAHYNRS